MFQYKMVEDDSFFGKDWDEIIPDDDCKSNNKGRKPDICLKKVEGGNRGNFGSAEIFPNLSSLLSDNYDSEGAKLRVSWSDEGYPCDGEQRVSSHYLIRDGVFCSETFLMDESPPSKKLQRSLDILRDVSWSMNLDMVINEDIPTDYTHALVALSGNLEKYLLNDEDVKQQVLNELGESSEPYLRFYAAVYKTSLPKLSVGCFPSSRQMRLLNEAFSSLNPDENPSRKWSARKLVRNFVKTWDKSRKIFEKQYLPRLHELREELKSQGRYNDNR